MNRVAVTGVGVVSPAGNTVDRFWTALLDGRSAIGPISGIPTDLIRTRNLAQVLDFAPDELRPEKKMISLLDRFSQFALAAARSATRDAGLVIDEELAPRVAVLIGTGSGGQITLDESYRRLYAEGSRKTHPFTIPRLMPNAATSFVGMDLGAKGPSYAIASACASGTHAIGQGFHMVRSGLVPVAIVGGSEACLNVGTIIAWESLRVISLDTCRPFSLNRTGMVLGEGAAVLVLEEWSRAAARGAPILAEICGFGMSADAADPVTPDCDGAVRAVQAALADAAADMSDVDYVNAHGTGTVVNDETEVKALRRAFGPHADRLVVSSNKGVLGHGLGAAGALEAVATVLTLRDQVVPPTANFEAPDPACDLDVVPGTAREMRVRVAISNSFAFGGLNAVLAFAAP